MIRDGYHAELDELRSIRRSGKSYIASLENKERQRTGIQSLKVRYNQVFGYYIEVTKSNLASVPADFIRRQTLVNAERYVTPELKAYEEKVLGAEERIYSLEKELFLQLRQQVVDQARRIQSVARCVATMDVLQSLGEAAARYRYSRPKMDSGHELYIKGCRHPVLEHCFDPFIPNDVYLNDTSHQLIILTGPNMGGKSTYLRQIALVVLMAHMGSFVPAADASISITDQLFTRVGASDNLARGRSTFMVEMVETANILNRATNRSLILLDEVGRGTATFDGLSIAWAIAEYLHNHESRRAKTVFATHYHEMTKLPKVLPGAKNYCMAVQESAGEILLLHRVMEGAANRSYGIEVARLAGIPHEVWLRAKEILSRLERRDIDLSSARKAKAAEDVLQEMQKSLF
jgi:DNA mismatch repair protein MutS